MKGLKNFLTSIIFICSVVFIIGAFACGTNDPVANTEQIATPDLTSNANVESFVGEQTERQIVKDFLIQFNNSNNNWNTFLAATGSFLRTTPDSQVFITEIHKIVLEGYRLQLSRIEMDENAPEELKEMQNIEIIKTEYYYVFLNRTADAIRYEDSRMMQEISQDFTRSISKYEIPYDIQERLLEKYDISPVEVGFHFIEDEVVG